MTERAIQNAIWQHSGQQHRLMCPNYTPDGWWECDMWAVTKSGYSVEFEIKLSLKDFKIDKQKQRTFYDQKDDHFASHEARWTPTERRKHAMLEFQDPRCPNRFIYVCPDGLLKPEDVPVWAGLMTYNPKRYSLSTEKEAPRLHSVKVPEKTIEHCRGVFFYRYWNLRMRLKQKVLTDSQNLESMGEITGGLPKDAQALDT